MVINIILISLLNIIYLSFAFAVDRFVVELIVAKIKDLNYCYFVYSEDYFLNYIYL